MIPEDAFEDAFIYPHEPMVRDQFREAFIFPEDPFPKREDETGIVVDQIVLQNVNPPDPVKPSFNEVNQAEQERERAINDARAAYNRIIPKARGQAEETIQQAEGYAIDRVNRARGDAVLFDEVLAAYKRAPEVTRRRIYLETMEAVYPGLERKLILDGGLSGVLPLLDLKQAGGGK